MPEPLLSHTAGEKQMKACKIPSFLTANPGRTYPEMKSYIHWIRRVPWNISRMLPPLLIQDQIVLPVIPEKVIPTARLSGIYNCFRFAKPREERKRGKKKKKRGKVFHSSSGALLFLCSSAQGNWIYHLSRTQMQSKSASWTNPFVLKGKTEPDPAIQQVRIKYF